MQKLRAPAQKPVPAVREAAQVPTKYANIYFEISSDTTIGAVQVSSELDQAYADSARIRSAMCTRLAAAGMPIATSGCPPPTQRLFNEVSTAQAIAGLTHNGTAGLMIIGFGVALGAVIVRRRLAFARTEVVTYNHMRLQQSDLFDLRLQQSDLSEPETLRSISRPLSRDSFSPRNLYLV